LSDMDIPHRTKFLKWLVDAYKQERDAMLDDMKASPGRISFTSDLWTDINLNAYMAITAHWI
ncbi:hypothetical protein K474DRAFT_1576793, partial [Panus rudis PR-1116 ss-1]